MSDTASEVAAPISIATMTSEVERQIKTLRRIQKQHEGKGETFAAENIDRTARALDCTLQTLKDLAYWIGSELTVSELHGVMHEVLEFPRSPALIAALHKVRGAKPAPAASA